MSGTVTLVYGGSFDPPHAMHARMATAAADVIGAGAILVLPAGVNPQRTGKPPAPAEHRLAMTRLAFAGDPRVQVDDREMRRGGVSYTVDTLEALHQEHPEARLRLLLGGDQAVNFGSWREPTRIETLAEPVVVPRPPLHAAALRDELARRTGNAAWIKRVLDIEPVETSSTDVRAMLARGERPGPDLLLPAVADYAMRHGLYRADAR